MANYRDRLRQVGSGHAELPNLDFDTGRRSRAGEYALGDKTYMKLLDKLSQHSLQHAPPDLRENILVYFSTPAEIRAHCRKDRKAWDKAMAELEQLRKTTIADQKPPTPSAAGRTNKSVFEKR